MTMVTTAFHDVFNICCSCKESTSEPLIENEVDEISMF